MITNHWSNIDFLKLKKKTIKCMWFIKNTNNGAFITRVVSIFVSNLLGFFLRLFPSKWPLLKLLFFSLLGADRLEQAIRVLISLENTGYTPQDESEIRLLYQSLSNYCLATYNLEPVLDVFKLRVQINPDSLWAWRILIDFTGYIGNYKDQAVAHANFLKARSNYAEKNGFDISSIDYYGSYFTNSIGHICLLADFAKLKILEGGHTKKSILFFDQDDVVNPTLLSYLFPYYEVIDSKSQSPAITKEQLSHLENPFCDSLYMFGQWRYPQYNWRAELFHKWDNKGEGPLLQLRSHDINYGWSQLHDMGIPKGAWFVTLHVRESGKESARNANIADYIPAIREITRRGGWVIRVGDKNMTPLPPLKSVIDWAHSDSWCDRVDIFLRGACKFSIETTSGPANIPELFGKRSLQTNLFPFKHSVPNSGDLVIPMLYYSKKQDRLLKFKEILSAELIEFGLLSREKDDLQIIKNSPNDIKDAVKEMIDGNVVHLSGNQIRFISICKELNVPFRPRIADCFLKRYKNLL